jgi:hypothetical protein
VVLIQVFELTTNKFQLARWRLFLVEMKGGIQPDWNGPLIEVAFVQPRDSFDVP